VTALRSPPLSRITGADSPVIADSSTEATPSTIFSVAGNDVARFAHYPVPFSKGDACDERLFVADELLAIVSVLDLRKASAWALRAPFGHRLSEVPRKAP